MKVSIVKYIVDKLKCSLAIVQDGDTATRNIASGKYVCWKGNMCTANQAIASGSTLSAASGGNLTACDDGALNEIGNDITAINDKMTTLEPFSKTIEIQSSSFPWVATHSGIMVINISCGYNASLEFVHKVLSISDGANVYVYNVFSFENWGISSITVPIIKGKTYTLGYDTTSIAQIFLTYHDET